MDFFKWFIIKGFILLTFTYPLYAKDQPEKIKKTVKESVKTRKSTQIKVEKWHGEKDRLKNQYFQLNEKLEDTKLEAGRMIDLLKKQDAYIARIHKKLLEMEKIKQNLIPYLKEVVAEIKQHIKNDLPFLIEERMARVNNLENLLYDPETTLGEKFRRVFEGLRVEIEYGRSVECTKEEIEYQGEKILVQLLRLGRTALLMRTLDGKDVAMYTDKGWFTLPSEYKSDIKKAIEIAQRRRPIEFVRLPVREVSP